MRVLRFRGGVTGLTWTGVYLTTVGLDGVLWVVETGHGSRVEAIDTDLGVLSCCG